MGELLEKYMEMSEGKQKNVSEQPKAVELANGALRAQKLIVVSEDATLAPIPKSRGTKRNRYAQHPMLEDQCTDWT